MNVHSAIMAVAIVIFFFIGEPGVDISAYATISGGIMKNGLPRITGRKHTIPIVITCLMRSVISALSGSM